MATHAEHLASNGPGVRAGGPIVLVCVSVWG